MYLIQYFKNSQWHNTAFGYKVENEEQAKVVFEKMKNSIENGHNPNKMEGIRLCQIIDSYIAPFDIPMPEYNFIKTNIC